MPGHRDQPQRGQHGGTDDRRLAAEGLNIENMINKSRGAYAYTMFDLSAAPGEEALARLQQIDGVLRIRVLP